MNLLNKQFLWCLVLMLSFYTALGQEDSKLDDTKDVKIDSLYREDQFYFAFIYNTLQQKPAGLNQQKFSIGLAGGFLRDMPINKLRTKAFAMGLGVSYNNYNQNLGISGDSQNPTYTILGSQSNFKKNKFTQLLIDLPVEFRWRTSTPQSYKFWRIYGGMKFSYLVYNKSVMQNYDGRTVIINNADFNKFLYGLYLSAGFNTLNVYAYYGLNPIFKSMVTIDGVKTDMKVLNIGVIFYIL